jgi:hypothetical protein
MIYLESSVLLEVYLGQERAPQALAILAHNEPKVSSWLLAVEVPIVLRRVLAKSASGRPLLAGALKRLQADLGGVSLFDGLPALAERIGSDERFAHCRSLDAVHVGSALLMHEMTNQAVRVATFDLRVAELTRALGMEVVS